MFSLSHYVLLSSWTARPLRTDCAQCDCYVTSFCMVRVVQNKKRQDLVKPARSLIQV